jgi:hypothetical protein
LQVEGGEVRDDFSDNVGREHERNLLRGWGIECSGTIRRLSSAVKVPLNAITDRLRESEDTDYGCDGCDGGIGALFALSGLALVTPDDRRFVTIAGLKRSPGHKRDTRPAANFSGL